MVHVLGVQTSYVRMHIHVSCIYVFIYYYMYLCFYILHSDFTRQSSQGERHKGVQGMRVTVHHSTCTRALPLFLRRKKIRYTFRGCASLYTHIVNVLGYWLFFLRLSPGKHLLRSVQMTPLMVCVCVYVCVSVYLLIDLNLNFDFDWISHTGVSDEILKTCMTKFNLPERSALPKRQVHQY